MTASYLANVKTTREVLESHGLATKKALGQHFLVNDGVVRHICELAELTTQDDVLEIGPGIGTLTVALLSSAHRVVSIERDQDLPCVLAKTCDEWKDSFSLINRDALEVTAQDLPFQPHKLVSNLPYAVAATLVFDAFERFSSLTQATVMVQSEVADRMAAEPGTKNYGAFTVKLALFARPVGKFSVAPGSFFPPPRVQSTVIRLDRVSDDLPSEDRRAITTMADAAFATRRKTIANSCRTFFARSRSDKAILADMITDTLDEAGIDPSRRGESLTLDEYRILGQAARKVGLV